MKLGLESYSVRNSGLDPIGVLQFTAQLGLQGVLFELSPFTSFADDQLERIRQKSEDLQLYLDFGMGSIFHWHPMAEKGRDLLAAAGYDVNVSEAKIVEHHLEVAQKLGSPILRCVGGNLFTRDEGHDMTALIDQAVAILRQACKTAEQMGMQIAMENHADFTVRELASIHARVNSPAFRFTVDTGNLAFDLDDPCRLAEIMAPHTASTHLKNYEILWTDRGLALGNCCLGSGDIAVPRIVEILGPYAPELHLNIEIHTQFAPFRLDILEEGFFARHPSPPGDGLAWYLRHAQKRTAPFRPNTLPDGLDAWKLEQEDLRSSIAWAKEHLATVLS